MRISDAAIERIRDSRILREKIESALGVSYFTIHRYLTDKNIMLTTAVVVDIIKQETRLTEEEIIVK